MVKIESVALKIGHALKEEVLPCNNRDLCNQISASHLDSLTMSYSQCSEMQWTTLRVGDGGDGCDGGEVNPKPHSRECYTASILNLQSWTIHPY